MWNYRIHTTVGDLVKLTVLAGLKDGTDSDGDSTAVVVVEVQPEAVLGFGIAVVDGTALTFPLSIASANRRDAELCLNSLAMLHEENTDCMYL